MEKLALIDAITKALPFLSDEHLSGIKREVSLRMPSVFPKLQERYMRINFGESALMNAAEPGSTTLDVWLLRYFKNPVLEPLTVLENAVQLPSYASASFARALADQPNVQLCRVVGGFQNPFFLGGVAQLQEVYAGKYGKDVERLLSCGQLNHLDRLRVSTATFQDKKLPEWLRVLGLEAYEKLTHANY